MVRGLAILFVLCWIGLQGCATTPDPHTPGGPFYFERFIHPFPSFYPTLPSNEISRIEATSRPFFAIAWFNERGQVERMIKCLNNQPSFDLRYRYEAEGSYEGEEFVALPPAEGDEGRRLTNGCS